MRLHSKAWPIAGVIILAATTLTSSPATAGESPKPQETHADQSTDELKVEDADRSEVEYGTPPPKTDPQVLGTEKKAGKCKYKHGGDDPHVTRGEVSAHGWWVITGGSGCSEKAKVKVKLQAWGCLKGGGCGWVTQRTGKARSLVANQTSKRANTRADCVSGKTVGWRNLVDVDLGWKVDPSGWDALGNNNLPCSPGA